MPIAREIGTTCSLRSVQLTSDATRPIGILDSGWLGIAMAAHRDACEKRAKNGGSAATNGPISPPSFAVDLVLSRACDESGKLSSIARGAVLVCPTHR